MSNWANRYLAAKQVTDMRSDPAESKLTVQTEEAGSGVLVPVSEEDSKHLINLIGCYDLALLLDDFCPCLTSTMKTHITNAKRPRPAKIKYITLAPRDYTIYTAPHVDAPVISIHTKPERSWFLVVHEPNESITIRGTTYRGSILSNDFGSKLGRMRVHPATDQGVFPFTIRTNWRALTNKKKLEEVKDAYQRLIQG